MWESIGKGKYKEWGVFGNTILISPWTNSHLDPPTAESLAKLKIALAELSGCKKMQQKDVCGSCLLYTQVQVLAALQLYTRQMNPMGKVRGKSALVFTWCPLWLCVVQQMAKLNQHPPAYHSLVAHYDFDWYYSSIEVTRHRAQPLDAY